MIASALQPSGMTEQLTRPQVQVHSLQSGLQRRVATFLRSFPLESNLLVALGDGEATLTQGDREATLAGPALFWRRRAGRCQLSLAAGASSIVAEITGEALARAIGDFFESGLLQSYFDADWERGFAAGDATFADVEESLRTIAEETRQQSIGGAMIVIARLRIILVSVLRVSAAAETAGLARGETLNHLRRFRQLLEVGFRAHRSVGDYADELGMTADRLHAICTRELGRTPKALIDQRVVREASIGLERSTLSIKQLSYALGFRDPAHFSNFFKRVTGISPGRFRRMVIASSPDNPGFAPPSYADWP
ncbi:MAG: AraC family transcriptional regulator [Rhizobiaceae bacterium]